MSVESHRTLAADHASDLWRWRPGFVRSLCYFDHDCVIEKCEMMPIEYQAMVKGDRVFVRLGTSDEACEGLIDRLTPLYGCAKTGQVHACGDRCDRPRDEVVCTLSGLTFGEIRRHGWWNEHPRDGSNDWRLDVRRMRVGVPRLDIRERLAVDRETVLREMWKASELIEWARARARLADKSEAFNVAFAVCLSALSDERFVQAIRVNHERRNKTFDQAKRAATHLVQRRKPLIADAIMCAMPAYFEPTPVLVQSREQMLDHVIRYADHCLAFWHLIFVHADPTVRDMSFRDFCAASLSLFGKGHNVPNFSTARNNWVIQPDRILSAFPVNRWIERQIYKGMPDTKISSIMRRAESRVKEIVDEFVARRDKNASYLRYFDLAYDEIGTQAFVGIKR
jgi:hypothetical protein